MQNQNYSTSFLIEQSPEEAYNAINNVKDWWSKDFTGNSEQLNDEFSVRFADVHYSKHKIIELIPNQKIVWLVTDSQLNFLKDKSEWNGTTNIFDLTKEGDKTKVTFTHAGLVPKIECFKDCSNGWNYFLHGILLPFIASGIGKPNKKGEKMS